MSSKRVDISGFTDKLKKLRQVKKEVTKPAFDFFKKQTPVKTGYAKSKTTLKGDTIEAQYPYASVLDDGRGFRDGQMRGSTQAPDGMTKPTLKEIARLVKAYVKRFGK